MNHSNDPVSLESPNRTLYDNLTDGNWSGYNEANRTSGANVQETEYIFDRPDVQAIFIILYTIVFCSCFFGNLLVILVVTLHWRMRSITNFCLANLAFADLCVGVFCVYQNLSTYLIASWVFGNFLCKMYHFINSLSHTASILILVVICIERYLAIIHPMRCKQMLTLNRLRLTVVAVWILSAILSSPRLYYIDTWTIPRNDGETEVICAPKRTLYDSVSLDLISMLVLFICPLIALTLLYTRIGVALWRSSRNQMSHPSASETSSSNCSGYGAHAEHAAVQVAKESRGCFCCCIGGRRRTRRRHQSRQPSYFYDGSTAQTNVVCCHCNGMTGFDGVSEDNGNHQRQFCVCTQCVMEDGSNGRVNGLWNGNGNHVKNIASPFSNNCRASGRRRRERGSEPLIVVKFKKRENNCARNGMNQCSIHLHSPNGNSDCVVTDTSVRTQIYGSDLVTADQQMDKHPCCCCTGQRNCDRAADVSGVSNGDGTLPNEVGKLNGVPLLGAGQQCCHQCGSRINGSHLGETSPRPARLKRMRVIRSSKYGTRALRSRRRIIRMLIIIVVTFAICNLPFHARKMWQNYSSSYRGGSNFSSIFTPVTFLIMYANSGINPLLYAFMSHKFRLSFRDLLYCKLRRSLRMSRRQSGRSTHIIPISTAV